MCVCVCVCVCVCECERWMFLKCKVQGCYERKYSPRLMAYMLVQGLPFAVIQ